LLLWTFALKSSSIQFILRTISGYISMLLPPSMTRVTLIKRYKRFLADVAFDNGDTLTAHCANTGAMTGLSVPGLPVWVWRSDNEKRKLPWSLELVELPSGLVGINTSQPNRLVAEALANKHIAPLAPYSNIRAEVKYGEKSRIDFLLTEPGLPDCYLEVKIVHYSRQSGLAQFPDSPTERGARHLSEMANMCVLGHRAVTIYVIQRTDCSAFSLCPDNAPAYLVAFKKAHEAGVEAYAYACDISPKEITLNTPLSFALT
jgi:sugar fermentation stimulation protein A